MTFENAVLLAEEVRRNGLWRVKSLFYTDSENYAVEVCLITRAHDPKILQNYDDWEQYRATTEALYMAPAHRSRRK